MLVARVSLRASSVEAAGDIEALGSTHEPNEIAKKKALAADVGCPEQPLMLRRVSRPTPLHQLLP